MVPEKKKKKRWESVQGAGVQYSWSRAVPKCRKAAQVMPVTTACVFISTAALCHQQSLGTTPTTL